MQWLFDIVLEMVRAAGMFVWRGETADYDFAAVDFTMDNTWYDLDLSAIVPEHANGVLLNVDVRCTLASKRVDFRHPSALDVWAVATVRTHGANLRTAAPVPVPCDSNRVIQYKVNNVNFDIINVSVVGWWF